MRLRLFSLVVFPLASLAAQETRNSSPVLTGLDPVELVGGVSKRGDDVWTTTRGRSRYLFANEANLRAFEKEPERFEIQLGGCCGRMGPGSGRGSPARFAVHDGRIYVFASDQCLAAFQKAPEKFLDPDESVAAGDESARAAGTALVEKAIATFGGAAALGPDAAYETSRTWKVKERDTERTDRSRLRISGDHYRLDEQWGDWSFTTIASGTAGFTVGNSGKVEDLHATAIRDIDRRMLRMPVLLLRARSRPGFTAVAMKVDGAPDLSYVAISVSGTTTTLGIDAKSGQVREARYRGRGPGLWYGEIIDRYGDFREVGAAAIPHRVDLTFDGKTRAEDARVFETVTIGGKIEDSVFARPAKGE